MEIRTYDEVDGWEVLTLNMLALDYPLTGSMVAALREHDRRYLPFFALYAVESGKVAGQVGLLTTTVASTEGPLKVGAVWAVATRPEFGRQGIARSLMKKVEQTAQELGCQAITLGTARTRVAHGFYRSLGYSDFLPIFRAFRTGPARQPVEPITIKQVPEQALAEAEQAFFANTGGMLGFVHRPEGFLRVATQTEVGLEPVHGVYRSGKLVGYLLAHSNGEFLRVRCAVIPQDLSLGQVLDALRSIYPTPYVVVSDLTRDDQVQSLREAGYDVRESWGTFMLKPLTPGRDFVGLLGRDQGRLYIDSVDIT